MSDAETHDEFLLAITTRYGWRDRLRILCGRTARATVWGLPSKVDKPEVLWALASVHTDTRVDPLWISRRRRGGYVVVPFDE